MAFPLAQDVHSSLNPLSDGKGSRIYNPMTVPPDRMLAAELLPSC